MPNRFASGKIAFAMCDVCGFRYKLRELRALVVKTKKTTVLACSACWVPDHPQLQLGMYPVDDPQALRDPRRDNTYVTSGVTATGDIGGGSRVIQWGWNPVGGARGFDSVLTPNDLISVGYLGTVTV